MTFGFDSGESSAQLTRIQDAVIGLLAELHYQPEDPETPFGPYLRTLAAIPDVPDSEYMMTQRTEHMGRMPGVLIFLGGSTRDTKGVSGQRYRAVRDLLLVIFAGRAANAVEGRLDETDKLATDNRDDPGIRTIYEHVVARLEGAQLDTPGVMGPIVVQGDIPLETGSDWTSWGIRCTLVVELTACPPDTRAADPLDVIRAEHDVQGVGVIVTQEEDVMP